ASVAVSVTAPQAVQCRLSNDAVTWSAWMAYAPGYQWTLAHGDGTKNVFAQCMNSGGTVSDTVEDTVILDSSPPPYISVSINNGARKVNSRDVTLGLYAFAGSRCRFANDNTVSWSAWEAYTTRKSWTLSNGDGAKTVYFNCQKANGADVGTATASVTLQVIPPYPPSGMSIEINGGAGQTSVKTVDLSLHAQGASQCRFSQDNYDWTSWADYAPYAQFTLKGGDGLKTVYYQCSNDYGTASTYSSIYLESGPPTGLSIQINGGAQYTTSQNVQLRLAATRAQQCRYMELGYDWSAWESFRTSKAFMLSAGDGRKTVSFQCRNDVGSASAEARIYLLTGPPGPVSDLSASAGDSYVRLSWSPPYGSDSGMIREYRLYRSTMSLGLFSRIGATGSRSYQDNNVENGETYSYYVTTVDIAGQEAHASNVVQATPGGLFGGG
ncbi:MAG: hypothetical protein PHF51_05320, partial [Candidatus ainarchaeum sp.]|nr:hypothetical protein [Candidatus ainarchaeum sp.]